jgi:hypothetical protein
MNFQEMRKALKRRQVLSALALVFVFFLGFHFHSSSPSQVTQECACLHGTRAQLAPTSFPLTPVPQFWVSPVVELPVSVCTDEESAQPQVRGPPASASL